MCLIVQHYPLAPSQNCQAKHTPLNYRTSLSLPSTIIGSIGRVSRNICGRTEKEEISPINHTLFYVHRAVHIYSTTRKKGLPKRLEVFSSYLLSLESLSIGHQTHHRNTTLRQPQTCLMCHRRRHIVV